MAVTTSSQEKNAARAIKHTQQVAAKYLSQTMESISATKIYDEDFSMFGNRQPQIILSQLDSVRAVFKFSDQKNTALLNFASFRSPGGGFMQGSTAQEESICHESNLYNILREFKMNYYDRNTRLMKTSTGHLFANRALYSKGVLFFDGDNIDEPKSKCDVITCAAPNAFFMINRKEFLPQQNTKALQSRIAFIRAIAEDQRVSTLILGAFGCGAFCQNPNEVATIFKDVFHNSCNNVRKIIYAIPPSKNYDAFKSVLESEDKFQLDE